MMISIKVLKASPTFSPVRALVWMWGSLCEAANAYIVSHPVCVRAYCSRRESERAHV